jgi:hypothetical protein
MMELADMPDLGSGVREDVGVQVSLRALGKARLKIKEIRIKKKI